MGILPHLIPFLKSSDPNLVLPVFSNHTMYTMKMITRPRFLAVALLATLCFIQASACRRMTLKSQPCQTPRDCLRRRLMGWDMLKPAQQEIYHASRRRLCPTPCDKGDACDGTCEGYGYNDIPDDMEDADAA